MLEEEVILHDYGPTKGYHRWIDNEMTRIYIRKRILPDTIPEYISILITDNPEKTADWDVRAEVVKEKEYNEQVRYNPTGTSYHKIGDPVISKKLLKRPYPEELYIGIRWELVT